MPAGICFPTTPSKMMFVALPRSLGPAMLSDTAITESAIEMTILSRS